MAHVVTGVVRRGGRAVRSLSPATVYAFGTNQLAYDAAIMAIRISSSSQGTEPTLLPHHVVPGLRKHSFVGGPPKS